MFDANGGKSPNPRHEKFISVEYMDLHILKPECGNERAFRSSTTLAARRIFISRPLGERFIP